MEKLALEALEKYDIYQPILTFIRHNENITYMVESEDKKYVLRIRKPVDGFTCDIFKPELSVKELMENEMIIIDYARRNTELALQKPIHNRDGEFVSCLLNGYPACLLEWIEGNTMNEKNITQEQALAFGRMAGQLHKVLQELDNQIKRFSYTQKLIQPMKEQLDEAMLKRQICRNAAGIMKEALNIIHYRMGELDSLPNMAGLLHADLGLSNIIVNEKGLIPIDFSLSGYGYYFMEVAMMMSQMKDKELRGYIKQGYEQISDREVPVAYIDAFFALSVLLYVCCQHNKVWQEDWFPQAVNRWCITIFEPLVNGIHYVL